MRTPKPTAINCHNSQNSKLIVPRATSTSTFASLVKTSTATKKVVLIHPLPKRKQLVHPTVVQEQPKRTMSSSTNRDPAAGGGSYVPPHKRHPQKEEGGDKNAAASPSTAAAAGHPPPPQKPKPNPTKGNTTNKPGQGTNKQGNHNNNNNNNNNNRNHSPKRNNNNRKHSKSPTRQQQHHHHPPPHHHHHHQHLDKEQLHHQQEQLQKLKDSLTRICCINLERRPDRWQSFQQHLQQSLGRKIGHSLLQSVERFHAVDGIPTTDTTTTQSAALGLHVTTTWDASRNAQWDRHITPPFTKVMTDGEVGCALSHVQLWHELAATPVAEVAEGDNAELQQAATTMMILEDDALFYSPRMAHVGEAPATTTGGAGAGRDKSPKGGRGGHKNDHHHGQHGHHHTHSPPPDKPLIANHDFLTAFHLAWTQLPEDWDIWYLGFSDRGDRLPVDDFHRPKSHHHDPTTPSLQIQIFRPTYGFHTHAYVLNVKAAKTLTANLPVQGPLDVWLADHEWFGLNVYCSVIANEGWQNTGAWLITQNRKAIKKNDSDIHQSGYHKNNNNNSDDNE